eukprot:3492586-Pleurochrysis_carterae.AAC.1
MSACPRPRSCARVRMEHDQSILGAVVTLCAAQPLKPQRLWCWHLPCCVLTSALPREEEGRVTILTITLPICEY